MSDRLGKKELNSAVDLIPSIFKRPSGITWRPFIGFESVSLCIQAEVG